MIGGCVGVIIPVYNEAATIDALLPRILEQKIVAEVILVDDGSSDASWELIEAWAAKVSSVKAVRHRVNRGKGTAVRTGLGLACSRILIVQDADLEYAPEDYAGVIQPLLRNEASVVYGTRFGRGANAQTTFFHRHCNIALTAVSNAITGYHLTDQATCYKAFEHDLLKRLALTENGFGICAEMTAKCGRAGIPIVEVPITYHARTRGQGKKLRWRHGIEALFCLFKYYFALPWSFSHIMMARHMVAGPPQKSLKGPRLR